MKIAIIIYAFVFLILIILPLNVFSVNSAARDRNEHNFAQGQIIIKLKDDNSNNNRISADSLQSQEPKIERLKRDFRIISSKKLSFDFNTPNRFNVLTNDEKNLNIKLNLFRKHGLDRLYLLEIEIDKNLDIRNIIRKLNSDPNIEYAEPNYIVLLLMFITM